MFCSAFDRFTAQPGRTRGEVTKGGQPPNTTQGNHETQRMYGTQKKSYRSYETKGTTSHPQFTTTEDAVVLHR